MLDITVQLKISVRMTPQVTTIICSKITFKIIDTYYIYFLIINY